MNDAIEDLQRTFGREALIGNERRFAEISELKHSLRQKQSAKQQRVKFHPEPGISIIVATYNGQSRLPTLLDSLATQTLARERFEIIIVENGGRRGAQTVVSDYISAHPNLQLRYFYREEPSAGAARNIGLQLAKMSRTTFVDDDDYLGEAFLEKALDLSTGTNVVISPIVNVSASGEMDIENSLNRRISELAKKGPEKLVTYPWALGFNACKLVPTWMLRDLEYRAELKSGEDLVFWAQLLRRQDTEVVAVAQSESSAYYRSLRDESISRRKLDFSFAVCERLDVIEALNEQDVDYNSPAGESVQSMAQAQAGFIARYIKENPSEESRVIEEIQRRNFRYFPWSTINKGRARDLAFVYCFAPFSDTSAVVAAKAIAERQRIVDIIADDMSSVRRKDVAVSALADRWIDKRTLIDSKPSFAGWNQISEFARKAVAAAERDHALKGPYQTVYSRALWAGSHAAGALFKLRHWNVVWSAEFSDPLRRNAEGVVRPGPIGSDSTWNKILDGVHSRGFYKFDPETLFDLIEVATFVLADELIFTNRNQLDYMLSLNEDPRIREMVRQKAVVRQHPEPPQEAYHIVPTTYIVPEGVANIAYFGSFYPNRGIGDVLVALANSRQAVREGVRLHVFSNKDEEVAAEAARLGVGPLVYSNGYLSYMEFLNATRLFDVLLVNDVVRGSGLVMNPFLPSKLSDYRGANRAIWGLVDEGSPLSESKLEFRSPVGNSAAMISVLEQIARSYQASGTCNI